MTCNVEANPEASIIWRKVGSLKLLSNTSELVLDPVVVEDGGNYTCLASNELGFQTSQPVEVNTFCKSIFSVPRIFDRGTLEVAMYVCVLVCHKRFKELINFISSLLSPFWAKLDYC